MKLITHRPGADVVDAGDEGRAEQLRRSRAAADGVGGHVQDLVARSRSQPLRQVIQSIGTDGRRRRRAPLARPGEQTGTGEHTQRPRTQSLQ